MEIDFKNPIIDEKVVFLAKALATINGHIVWSIYVPAAKRIIVEQITQHGSRANEVLEGFSKNELNPLLNDIVYVDNSASIYSM